MKQCIICKTDTTPQWYTGPKCKRCYRKKHREEHLEEYKNRDKAYYEDNAEAICLDRKEYYKENTEMLKQKSRAHYEKVGSQRRPGSQLEWQRNNPDKTKQYRLKQVQNNPERVKEYGLRWHAKNPEYSKFIEANRRAAKLERTPKWLTTDQRNQMKEIYKNCPEEHDVDHIVPLQGKNVSGLHVPWNLQYLTSKENRKKGNKF
jgi:hypothetical protein